MEESRVNKSLKNTGFGVIGMALSLLVQFISRTVFIKLLGDEYNGINGLFSNILYVLNVAELGVAYSIAYALYAPLQEENRDKICAIMNFLRRTFIMVCATEESNPKCVALIAYLLPTRIRSMYSSFASSNSVRFQNTFLPP